MKNFWERLDLTLDQKLLVYLISIGMFLLGVACGKWGSR